MANEITVQALCYSHTAISKGLDNAPNEEQTKNLERLIVVLDDALTLLGISLFHHSGFRTAQLNAIVGGTQAPPSAHLDGRAEDFDSGAIPIHDAWTTLKDSELPYDQLIIEQDSHGNIWIHLAIARVGEQPRREAFPLTKRDDRIAH